MLNTVPWGKVVDTKAEGTNGTGCILIRIADTGFNYEEVTPGIRVGLHVGLS